MGDDPRPLPFADVPVAANDPFDIAAVAVAALTGPDAHTEMSYRLSGPEAILPATRVSILGELLDRDLECRAQTDDEARAEMSEEMPSEYANAFFAFFRGGESDETTVRPAVSEVLGREPRTFRQWAEQHVSAFR